MNDPEFAPIVSDQDASAHIDLYALTHKDIQEPPATMFAALSKIGPGLILAASIVGTGELINTTALGAKQGFVLLWLILISCVIKVFVQVEMGRYAITRGKTSLAAIDSIPGPRLGVSWICWCWLVMMLLTIFQIAAMEGLVGEAAVMVFHGDDGATKGNGPTASIPLWAGVTCVAAIALLLSGGYKRLERITTVLVALVTLVTVVGALRVPISWAQIQSGLSFSLPSTQGGLFLAFSAFGITGVGASELFAYPYWCIEKGYARAAGPRDETDAWAARARGWIKVMQLDAWFSMVVFTLATVAFYAMGAGILNKSYAAGTLGDADLGGSGMIRTLAKMYVEALGPWAKPFFLAGAWAVLFKTLYVATAANSRMMADFLNLGGFWRYKDSAGRERVVRVFCTFFPLLALGIFLAEPRPLKLVMIGGVAQALMLPLIAGATLFLRYRDADRRVGPNRLSDVLSWAAFAGTLAVATYTLVDRLMAVAAWARSVK